MEIRKDFIEAEIIDVKRITTRMGPISVQYFAWYLMLGEKGGNRRLPIVIGDAEATSILVGLTPHQALPRPLSHDLMMAVLNELGARILYSAVVDIKNNTFYGEIAIEFNKKILKFDSRPSDAIALAVRAKCPIYVAKSVMDEAGISTEEMQEVEEQQEEEKQEKKKTSPRAAVKKLEDLSIDELKKALQKAVEEENYELAARIRDIIRQKEGGGSQ